VAEAAGLTASDVKMSYMAPADVTAALQTKQIDLAVLPEPFVTMAVQQGSAARWHEMNDDFPDLPYSTVLFGPSLTDKDAEGGPRFLGAYLAGMRDFEEAFARQHNRDAIVDLIADPMKTPPALLDAIEDGGGIPFFEPNGAVSIEPLQPALDVWVELGLAARGFDMNHLVDPAPARAAVTSSGEYH
jgi:NitT/TauT family transport system substrate-binding protein